MGERSLPVAQGLAQHELLRKTHLPHDFLKARIRAKVIPPGIDLDEGDLYFAFLQGFFQRSQSLFSFAQAVVNHREAVCGNIVFRSC